MIYLYAITEPNAADLDCRGLEDQPVCLLRESEVAGVYSAHEELRCRPDPEALWRHEQVVEEAMSGGPALPARFGTTFGDTAALGAILRREGRHIREALEQVRGCVELAVRVGFPTGARPVPRDGRAYVEARLADRRERQSAASRTLAPLADLAVRARTGERASEASVITASYLVREGDVQRFAEAVKLLQRRDPELALSCTGPWAPYSFVDREEAA